MTQQPQYLHAPQGYPPQHPQVIYVPQPFAPGTGVCTKSRVLAGLLALLLGTFGVHKFYLGRIGQGIVYVIFFWTWIPALLGICEGIYYLTMNEDAFCRKYGSK